MSFTIHPVKLHDAAINMVDRANNSERNFLVKGAAIAGSNAVATVTGVAAAAFKTGTSAVQLVGALAKYAAVGTVRVITRDYFNAPKAAFEALPGFNDSWTSAKKAMKQTLGVFTSLGGVLIVGSKFNVETQSKLGNALVDRQLILAKDNSSTEAAMKAHFKAKAGNFEYGAQMTEKRVDGFNRLNLARFDARMPNFKYSESKALFEDRFVKVFKAVEHKQDIMDVLNLDPSQAPKEKTTTAQKVAATLQRTTNRIARAIRRNPGTALAIGGFTVWGLSAAASALGAPVPKVEIPVK